MSKHTPGPWVYGPEFSAVLTRDKQGTVAILLPLGHTRDDEDIDTEMMDAHGRLMAAAPEMKAKLDEMAEFLRIVYACIPEEIAGTCARQITNWEILKAKIEGDEE